MTSGRVSRAVVLLVAAGVLGVAACSGTNTQPGDASAEGAGEEDAEPTSSVPTVPMDTIAIPVGGGTTIITLPTGLASGGQGALGAEDQAAGSSTTTSGVPSDPGSAFCQVAKGSGPGPMDVTDPAVASVLQQLLEVAPAPIAEQLRFLVDVNIRLERIDPEDVQEVDALSQLYSSGEIDRATDALGVFVVDTCGIDLGL